MKKIPQPLSVLMIIIVMAAILTWILPAGKYNTLSFKEGASSFTYTSTSGEIALPFAQKTLDSLGIKVKLESFARGDIRKPLSVPGTYQKIPSNSQNFINVIKAPLKGIYEAIDIILLILVIGAFINVFNSTGAMESGLSNLSLKMKGREGWLIIILTFLLSFGGASYGMAEEALAFYPILVPLFIAAGYDLLVPVAVIFGGTQIGTLASFSNPFSTIIASNAAGISWTDGLYGRIGMFMVSSAVLILYIGRYAQKVKKDPKTSLVYKMDGIISQSLYMNQAESTPSTNTGTKNGLLLLIFLITFLTMIGGVVFLHWWLLEMSAVFLVSAILLALITGMGEKIFLEKFIKGAENLLGVAFIVGVARGITIILSEGTISDSILYYSVNIVGGMPPSYFIVVLLLLYMVFTLFISSSSGMAVVTMPVIGSLAFMVGIPGREIVNSYLFGMGIMGLITPTGLILPSLAMAGVSLKAWLQFIWPLMLLLFFICAIFLIIGINI